MNYLVLFFKNVFVWPIKDALFLRRLERGGDFIVKDTWV